MRLSELCLEILTGANLLFARIRKFPDSAAASANTGLQGNETVKIALKWRLDRVKIVGVAHLMLAELDLR